MTALLSYAVSSETGNVLFAIATDDTQAHYVWPAQVTPGFDDQRIQQLTEDLGSTPQDAMSWLTLASDNIGLLNYVTAPVVQGSIETAVAEARQVLNRSYADDASAGPPSPSVMGRVREAFDQVSADYPGFGEGAEDDPQAMTNFVLSMIGGVEEGGPNAWIAEAMQNPNPDAEPGGFVAFPGVDYNGDYPPAEETPE